MYNIESLTTTLTYLILLSYGHVFSASNFFQEKLTNHAKEKSHNPDAGPNISQFLEKYGYPLETHEITTDDGYILTLHRVPYGKNGPGANKPAILLMHPLLCTSIDMVNLGPGKSIGLKLADEGYDVWLGNIRGNTLSRRHVTLNPDTDKEFWNFSFDEAGFYDLPANIDYILKLTGHSTLSYIGHSQGSTQFFTMATLRPEYNKKITVMVAFAPAAHLRNMTQPLLRLVADNLSKFAFILDFLNINEFMPHTELLANLTKTLCYNGSPFIGLCVDFIFYLCGSDPAQMDESFVEVLGSNAPSGTSAKTIKHFAQVINSGLFRRFDYKLLKNLEVYHQPTPPEYDFSLITTPVALYYGGSDLLVPAINGRQLAGELPNVVENRLIDIFNHLDFIWGKDADSILYRDVIDLLNKYNNM